MLLFRVLPFVKEVKGDTDWDMVDIKRDGITLIDRVLSKEDLH